MNIFLARKYRKRQRYFSSLLAKNPVLVLGLDLPFVIACSTTLKIAVALSIEMFIIHMVTMACAMLTVRFLPFWARMLVNVGISTVIMTVARQVITIVFPDITNYIGMYMYLMAVNGLTIYQASSLTRKQRPLPVLVSALLNALAFSLTMLVVSFFRELFAGGTLWGIAVNLPFKLSGLALPFAGFILIGLLLAFVKFINKKLLAFSISESMRQDVRYMRLR